MYTMKYNKGDQLWTVGIDQSSPEAYSWTPLGDFQERREAVELISFLNGGEKPSWWAAGTNPV